MNELKSNRVEAVTYIVVGDTKWDRVIKIWDMYNHEWNCQPRAHVVTVIYIKIWTYYTWLIKYTLRLPDIGRTVLLLKPPQSPHCSLGAVDHAKNSPPSLATWQARSYRANRATQTPLFSSPLILLRRIMEMKFAQNLHWHENWH